jgi:thioredoxin reductase (NADPH)
LPTDASAHAPPPILCIVHDERSVREVLVNDLTERFGSHYELEAHAGARSALEALRAHADAGRRVAAVFSSDSETCGGEDFWAEMHGLYPRARRVLMVGRGEWSKAHPAVAAMRTGHAESYIFVPWGPRERWLYLPVSEILADWEASQRPEFEAVQVIGHEWEPRAHALRDVFSRVGVPFGFYPPSSTEGRRLLAQAGLDEGSRPVITFRTGGVLVDPRYDQVATALGFATEPDSHRCDLAIIGGGPAGLAAAVYGASEGLDCVVIDEALPGGQAGTSSRIRNYLGFPTGVSGRDLMTRALEQAWFFGARVVLSKRALGIDARGTEYAIELADGRELTARTVVVATGVSWRRLNVPALEALRGAGVFYGAAASDTVAVDGAQSSSSAPVTRRARPLLIWRARRHR